MNYCRECKKILEKDEQECPFCGAKVEQNTFADSIDQEEYREEELTVENTFSDETPIISEVKNNVRNEVGSSNSNPLSNWIKVTLSVCISILPGLGPLIGIIASIIFMTHDDEDRKSFGYALLTYSVIFLIVLCACCMLLAFMTPMGLINQ